MDANSAPSSQVGTGFKQPLQVLAANQSASAYLDGAESSGAQQVVDHVPADAECLRDFLHAVCEAVGWLFALNGCHRQPASRSGMSQSRSGSESGTAAASGQLSLLATRFRSERPWAPMSTAREWCLRSWTSRHQVTRPASLAWLPQSAAS